MDKSCNVKGRKPDTKEHIVYSVYVKVNYWQTFGVRIQDSDYFW